jgi:hypothetical protein
MSRRVMSKMRVSRRRVMSMMRMIEFEEVVVEDDKMCDEEGMDEGHVEFEVVDEAAPWAGVPHKGKGKGSGGARIETDDDGGPFTVVLDIVVRII